MASGTLTSFFGVQSEVQLAVQEFKGQIVATPP